MLKWLKRILVLVLVLCAFYLGTVAADKNSLQENLIRFHVVANSDAQADQNVKLQVRDAILARLKGDLQELQTAEDAKNYLQEHLAELEALANRVLANAGSLDKAKVTLELEAFPKRVYDTFSLPSGVYEALRVTIGAGEGKNWWCVVFPELCLPATSQGFLDTAAASGLSEPLTESLTGEYELRFFLLDCLGELENFFFAG